MPLKHDTYEGPDLLGELLLFELSPEYCRESITLKKPATALPMGTILVKNADGSFQAWASADADTGTDAAGVLLRDVEASPSADVVAPAVRRGALVSAFMLHWPAGTADDKKKAALAALETIGIVVR